jgi:hypothetical protein
MSRVLNILKRYSGLILLTVSSIIGFCIYDDYGIAWDDPTQRAIGEVSYNYVFHHDQTIKKFYERDYGVAYELPLFIGERLLRLKDSRDIYLMRHIASHLFFLLCSFVCFLLIDALYKSKLLATIGFLFLWLNPLLFSHSFFNTKDIPFMSVFIICFFLAVMAFRKKKLRYFVFTGIACALLTNLRIAGIMLACCFCLLLIVDIFFDRKDKKIRNRNIYYLLIFLGSFMVALYASWPYLWENPLHNFVTVFQSLSKYREVPVLFSGITILSPDLPWYYGLAWFLMSTPVIYIAAGIAGIIFFILKFIKKPLSFIRNDPGRINTIFFICFFLPILALIIFRSGIYDGWRHMYFIYPSFILFAIYGLHHLFITRMKKIILIIVFGGFLYSGYFMVASHPFQYIYFNRITGIHKAEYFRNNFEMDYWGLSYKQAFEYILKNDPSARINVGIAYDYGTINHAILKREDRERIVFTTAGDAKYFITNYRWHPKDYYPESKIFHSFKVLDNSINTIYRLK